MSANGVYAVLFSLICFSEASESPVRIDQLYLGDVVSLSQNRTTIYENASLNSKDIRRLRTCFNNQIVTLVAIKNYIITISGSGSSNIKFEFKYPLLGQQDIADFLEANEEYFVITMVKIPCLFLCNASEAGKCLVHKTIGYCKKQSKPIYVAKDGTLNEARFARLKTLAQYNGTMVFALDSSGVRVIDFRQQRVSTINSDYLNPAVDITTLKDRAYLCFKGHISVYLVSSGTYQWTEVAYYEYPDKPFLSRMAIFTPGIYAVIYAGDLVIWDVEFNRTLHSASLLLSNQSDRDKCTVCDCQLLNTENVLIVEEKIITTNIFGYCGLSLLPFQFHVDAGNFTITTSDSVDNQNMSTLTQTNGHWTSASGSEMTGISETATVTSYTPFSTSKMANTPSAPTNRTNPSSAAKISSEQRTNPSSATKISSERITNPSSAAEISSEQITKSLTRTAIPETKEIDVSSSTTATLAKDLWKTGDLSLTSITVSVAALACVLIILVISISLCIFKRFLNRASNVTPLYTDHQINSPINGDHIYEEIDDTISAAGNAKDSLPVHAITKNSQQFIEIQSGDDTPASNTIGDDEIVYVRNAYC